MTRKSSGIPGLDKLIEGGFPDGSIVLYSGAPGTGKTIAAMQFIVEGMKKGEKCRGGGLLHKGHKGARFDF